MYTAVQNGRIVTEERIVIGDIVISEEGKIVDILPAGISGNQYPLGEVADVRGKYVVPGGIDGHVHFGGIGNMPIADDFYTGSKAALAGGTTTVVDFCESAPDEDPLFCIQKRKKEAESSLVDYTFHYSFTKNYKEQLKYLDRIAEEGIATFKIYTYYENTALQPCDIREVLHETAGRGTLLIHAEEKTIIDKEKAKVPEADRQNMRNIALTRPPVTELISANTMLALAKECGAKTCIAHVSAGPTAEIRKRERLAGNNNFLLETCPHYLYLTQDRLDGPDGALFTMNPPLRLRKDIERLWLALMEGDIQMLSTDHCPFREQEKRGHDFLTVPCGVDGVQTRMLFLFSEGVIKRNLPMTEFVKLTSGNAAKFYHLYPRKGVIRIGSDADLTVIDPDCQWTWDASAIAGATDYSILDGMKLTGRITHVLKGGKIVVRDGAVSARKGSGRFLSTAEK